MTGFQGFGPLSRKENSSRGFERLLWFVSRCRDREIITLGRSRGRSRSSVPESGPDSLSAQSGGASRVCTRTARLAPQYASSRGGGARAAAARACGSSTVSITPFPRSGFPCALGSTHSCSTTVHMKPFSASVLQDPSGVFATTTKICTDGGSGQARAHNPSTLTVATPLLVGA